MVYPKLWPVFVLWMFLSSGFGQDVRLELGFKGEMVAEHWNPLRLIRRDMGPATLTLSFDQGTLRQGQIPVIYTVSLKAAQGLDVFEDDIYIPYWRSFTWRLADDKQVFASGSFDRQLISTQSLHLVISKSAETWLDMYDDTARIVQGDDLLPQRLAAYDGVASLLIDGSTPLPSLSAISSATAAGVQVFLIEPWPESYNSLSLIASQARQRLGAGWLVRSSAKGVKAALAMLPKLDTRDLQTAILAPFEMPKSVPTPTLLAGAGIYSLLVLLFIRFLGSAGLATAFLLTAICSLGAWTWLRPMPQEVTIRSLFLNAGNLAQVSSSFQINQLPKTVLHLSIQAHPASTHAYTQGDTLELNLGRWSQETLFLKPKLSTATLRLEGNRLSNRTDALLTDVYVSGLGKQNDLSAGASFELQHGEEGSLFESLLPLLPVGTVLARQADDLHIAIPSLDFTVQ
jgi:hypothetical protein